MQGKLQPWNSCRRYIIEPASSCIGLIAAQGSAVDNPMDQDELFGCHANSVLHLAGDMQHVYFVSVGLTPAGCLMPGDGLTS
ncbi:hypothetical protein HCU01_22200 [Halomonas cupida]|uniref:Uncharacterized protein n=1 Tax=Halomonas cupida TaxID=44933 RepID=A0ABQ0WF51_9GAMM|nr:hypothetical protein HCU01_22200 [Halomonas cupida]